MHKIQTLPPNFCSVGPIEHARVFRETPSDRKYILCILSLIFCEIKRKQFENKLPVGVFHRLASGGSNEPVIAQCTTMRTQKK